MKKNQWRKKTRPDTRLPKWCARAGKQRQWSKGSTNNLSRGSNAKTACKSIINIISWTESDRLTKWLSDIASYKGACTPLKERKKKNGSGAIERLGDTHPQWQELWQIAIKVETMTNCNVTLSIARDISRAEAGSRNLQPFRTNNDFYREQGHFN